MYDQFGRYVEYEEYEPTLRRHCKQCGAFLPIQPIETWRSNPDTGERTSDEPAYIWPCAKCGRDHHSWEMDE